MDARQSHDEGIDEDLRRRFERAWLQGQPLPIEDCLPPREAATWLPTLEELVHIELEFAWKAWADQRRTQGVAIARVSTAHPRKVEQYLALFPSLDQPEIVARLVEQECFVRAQAGDRPAADEYLRRFGHHLVTAIAGDTLPRMAATWRSDRTALDQQPPGASGPPPSPKQKRFGNYELLEELGRGGMGIVYRARQLSADRIVALKVIRADQLSNLRPELRTSAVERFRHEALAAARLEHEHIVTVYEVGEADGERFFSMRYVEGQSLADLLSLGGPFDGRKAAAYLEPVARAVAAAHEAGILHRDLKPQNILVDAKTDRPLIADFGLAKLLEQSSELTRAGDVMGTPAYMSPEQACDSTKVTVRSDVYSLGATLYHAIAARPPFQAATSLETLRQTQEEQPVAPSQLNPAIDRDLETICLTCLHKEPARRYATAAALADDLRRYLDGMPILARPVGPGERVARWCRRNPLLAGALGLAAVFFVAALVATSVGYVTTAAALRDRTKALQERTQALDEKTTALEESERSYRQSREVVNQFFTLVSEDTLLNQPGTQSLRIELLKLALGHFQRFLAVRGEDPALLEEIARTHYRVALIMQAIDPEAAVGRESLNKALRIQRDLLAHSPQNDQLQDALGDTLNALGQVHQHSGDSESALSALEESRQLRQQLASRLSERMEFRRKLANTIMNIGLIYKQLGRFDDAIQSLDEAQSSRKLALEGRNIAGADAEELLLWRDLAQGHYNRANLAVAMQQPTSAEAELTPAIAVLDEIGRIAPNDLRNRERLAACYHLAARLRHDQRDDSEAARRYAQAIAALEDLHRNNPQVVEFQERLALVYMDQGTLHVREQKPEAALAAYTSACDLLRGLVPAPDSTEYPDRRRNYAVALREFSRAQFELKQPTDLEQLALSQQILERLIDQVHDVALRKRLKDDLDETRQLLLELKATAAEAAQDLPITAPLMDRRRCACRCPQYSLRIGSRNPTSRSRRHAARAPTPWSTSDARGGMSRVALGLVPRGPRASAADCFRLDPSHLSVRLAYALLDRR
ncbi:MAG: serine/threonine-protein kinase [Planctomycetaceae bacterium]|nr:serine/threonine-protein kinase [Planctomycetaceae bacterium]